VVSRSCSKYPNYTIKKGEWLWPSLMMTRKIRRKSPPKQPKKKRKKKGKKRRGEDPSIP